MNWSVVSQRKSDENRKGGTKVFDVVCRRGGMDGTYGVYLERSDVKRRLGTVMKDYKFPKHARDLWVAVPDDLYPRTIKGFATRRAAIEYMLKDQGYYWEENATRSAGQLNTTHIGMTIVYTYHNGKDEIDHKTIGPIKSIIHSKNQVQITFGDNKRTNLPWHGVIREER